MKIKFDCLPCIFRQTIEASQMAAENEEVIREIINEYAKMIPDISFEDTGPEVVTRVQNIIKDKTGKIDPYHDFKNKNIKKALSHYPDIEQNIEKSDQPLLNALIMSAMGNAIDAGVSLKVDMKSSIDKAAEFGFIKSDFKKFKNILEDSQNVLIIADNAGEAVFDRLLIKELNKYNVEITYAVREKPILNDVTLREAKGLGIDESCNLISSGCKAPGLILEKSSNTFKKYYKNADLRISKGQGNLEGLSEVKEDIFFLLKAKCELVADLLGVEVGDLVFILNII